MAVSGVFAACDTVFGTVDTCSTCDIRSGNRDKMRIFHDCIFQRLFMWYTDFRVIIYQYS